MGSYYAIIFVFSILLSSITRLSLKHIVCFPRAPKAHLPTVKRHVKAQDGRVEEVTDYEMSSGYTELNGAEVAIRA